MTSRERKLGLLLVLMAALCAIVYIESPPSFTTPVDPRAPKHYVVGDALADEFKKIRAAETNDDLEKRCLATPDLAEFSWDPKLVKAMCRLLSRKMISWKELNDALDRRDAAFLQQTFDGYLETSFKHGHHGFIDWTYANMFNNASKEELETTTRWIELDPDSAYALAARGTHYVQAAYEARGAAYARDTPSENFDRMRECIVKARSDFDAALERNPKLITVYVQLLRIAQLTGDEDLRYRSVTKALAIDSADHFVYDYWIDAAEPRWGGSLAEMERAGRLAAEHAKANPILGRMQGRATCDRALQATCTNCSAPPDNAKALKLFRESAAHGATRCFLLGAAWSAAATDDLQDAVRYYTQAVRFLNDGDSRVRRAGILYTLGEREWAMQDLDVLLKGYPNYIEALNEKAYLVDLENHPAEAETLYLRTLTVDPNNERAGLELSRLYLSELPNFDKAAPLVAGLLERNPKLARAWLYKAALARGNEAACREALQNYLKYVDRNNAYEKNDIAGAQARLNQLNAKRA